MNVFKNGDRVKLNPVYEKRLDEIGLASHTVESLGGGIIVRENWSDTESLIDFPKRGTSYFIPRDWMMLEERPLRPHPLTNIFKDKIPLDKQ